MVFNIQKGLKKKPVGRKNPNKLWGPRGLKKKSKQTLGPYTGLKVQLSVHYIHKGPSVPRFYPKPLWYVLIIFWICLIYINYYVSVNVNMLLFKNMSGTVTICRPCMFNSGSGLLIFRSARTNSVPKDVLFKIRTINIQISKELLTGLCVLSMESFYFWINPAILGKIHRN